MLKYETGHLRLVEVIIFQDLPEKKYHLKTSNENLPGFAPGGDQEVACAGKSPKGAAAPTKRSSGNLPDIFRNLPGNRPALQSSNKKVNRVEIFTMKASDQNS